MQWALLAEWGQLDSDFDELSPPFANAIYSLHVFYVLQMILFYAFHNSQFSTYILSSTPKAIFFNLNCYLMHSILCIPFYELDFILLISFFVCLSMHNILCIVGLCSMHCWNYKIVCDLYNVAGCLGYQLVQHWLVVSYISFTFMFK